MQNSDRNFDCINTTPLKDSDPHGDIYHRNQIALYVWIVMSIYQTWKMQAHTSVNILFSSFKSYTSKKLVGKDVANLGTCQSLGPNQSAKSPTGVWTCVFGSVGASQSHQLLIWWVWCRDTNVSCPCLLASLSISERTMVGKLRCYWWSCANRSLRWWCTLSPAGVQTSWESPRDFFVATAMEAKVSKIFAVVAV